MIKSLAELLQHACTLEMQPHPIVTPKRQGTVETATFGSEFVAARIATDQITDLGYTLMYLGVPIRSKSYMFGDNKSVVDSASIPTSILSKKSILAYYHRVREAIAAGYLQFNWKDGKSNPGDILSKYCEFASIWPLLKCLLFWKGDTHELTVKTSRVTEFLLKRLFLSLTLMDKGQTNNPNVTPSNCPTKFWGLLAMVAPIAHMTHQNSLIGSSSKINLFHWLRC